MKVSKVIKHLHGDIKNFKHEADDDRALLKDLKKASAKKKASSKKKSVSKKKVASKKKVVAKKKYSKADDKIAKVMEEYHRGALHSGSKKGPRVHKEKQALAIAFSEAKRAKKKRKK